MAVIYLISLSKMAKGSRCLCLVVTASFTFFAFYFAFLYLRLTYSHRFVGNIPLKDARGRAEIFREENGIPHIFADNEEMAFYSYGFVHASDRLYQMDRMRRLSYGSLSEIFGAEALPLDKIMRPLQIGASARERINDASPRILTMLQAFSDGVNAFVNFDKPPIEYAILGASFEPWQPADTVAIVKLLEFFISYDGLIEIGRELAANLTSDDFAREFFPFEEEFFGYENFTILNEDELKQEGMYVEKPYHSRFPEVKFPRINTPYRPHIPTCMTYLSTRSSKVCRRDSSVT